MRLDPYQDAAIAANRELARAGAVAILNVAPTGAGKTVIMGATIRNIAARGRRSCVIAHRTELVSQAARTFERGFGLVVGSHGLNPSAPVLVTSIQTITKRCEVPEADIYFLDEAHHYESDDWTRVPRHLLERGKRIFGYTATPERGDGRPLGKKSGGLFDAIHVVAQISELQAINAANPHRGLVPCDWKSVQKRLKAGTLAMDPFEAWARFAKRRPTVVFAPNILSAETFAAKFNASGVAAGVVYDGLSSQKRAQVLADFARGALDVLCNVAILTEGWDCPRAKVCILARPCGSTGLYLQIVGRVLRATGVREEALLIDLVGAVDAHGPPDMDREFQLDGDFGIGWKGQSTGVRLCKVCQAELAQNDAGKWLPCPDCEREVEGPKVPTVLDLELGKWAWTEKLNTDQRVEYLARWYAGAAKKGHKLATAHFRFKGMFSHFPTTAIRVAAMKAARVNEKGESV
jgi:DNA repair protein RadD